MVVVDAVPFCERDWSIWRFSINKVFQKQYTIDTKKWPSVVEWYSTSWLVIQIGKKKLFILQKIKCMLKIRKNIIRPLLLSLIYYLPGIKYTLMFFFINLIYCKLISLTHESFFVYINIPLILFILIERRFYCVTQVDLKVVILLPLSPQ